MSREAKYVIAALGVVVVAAAGTFFVMRRGNNTPSVSQGIGTSTATPPASTTTQTATATLKTGVAVGVIGTGKYTITPVSAAPAAPAAPDFRTPLVCGADITSDVCAALTADAAKQAAVLSKNGLDFKGWVDLGLDRKHAGDYTGAAKAWEYVSALYPTNVVSFNNLGDLYMNFIHNYPAAESNYLKQLKNRPTDVNAYYALFTLYTQLYKQNTSAGVDILEKGIAANPGATGLQALLTEYQQSKAAQ